jgi:uncharacterized protein
LLPERDLPVRIEGERVHPSWLTTRDFRWVERLLDRLPGLAGRPRHEVEARLGERPELGESGCAWRCAVRLVLRQSTFEIVAAIDPKVARRAVFDAAAAQGAPTERSAVLRRVASEHGIGAGALESSLYADLPRERLFTPPSDDQSASDFCAALNLAIGQALLWRAERLHVRVSEHLEAVLRMARLSRLLCWAQVDPKGRPGALLSVSGPLAVFHRTTVYGREMASWLPFLARTRGWSLDAICMLGDRRVRWCADHRDPIRAGDDLLRRFDSRLEQRLFRDLQRIGPEWEVLRESEVVQVGRRLVAPDFVLRHRATGRSVAVEVVGFWTPRYLAAKIATIRALEASSVRWILCVDESLGITDEALPRWPILRFRRRIDARALLDLARKQLESSDR